MVPGLTGGAGLARGGADPGMVEAHLAVQGTIRYRAYIVTITCRQLSRVLHF